MLAATATAAEYRDESKFRFGVGANMTEIGFDEDDLGVELDFKSKGWEAFFGYEFNRYFAIEAGYMDVGEDTVSILGVASALLDTTAYQASVLGSLPLGDWGSVYGRAGLLHWEAAESANVPSMGLIIAGESEGDDPFFGVGAALNVEGALVRLEYRLAEIDDADLNQIGLQIAWRF
jgi:hypothetical protein